MALGFAPFVFRRQCRPCRDSAFGLTLCLNNEFGETFEGIFAIGLLGTETLRKDDDLAVVRESATGDPLEARSDGGRQLGRVQIQPQLHGGRDLIDVLTAGTCAADE